MQSRSPGYKRKRNLRADDTSSLLSRLVPVVTAAVWIGFFVWAAQLGM